MRALAFPILRAPERRRAPQPTQSKVFQEFTEALSLVPAVGEERVGGDRAHEGVGFLEKDGAVRAKHHFEVLDEVVVARGY